MLNEAILKLLTAIIEVLGPALVRKHVDEYELGRATSNAAFRAKFEEDP